MVKLIKSLSHNEVNAQITTALKEQQADFNAQIKGLFNTIILLTKRIDMLERKPDPASRKIVPRFKNTEY